MSESPRICLHDLTDEELVTHAIKARRLAVAHMAGLQISPESMLEICRALDAVAVRFDKRIGLLGVLESR